MLNLHGEPALSFIKRALEHDKHVVTTNKGPIALKFQELYALARSKNLEIGVEGTVMSGTPTIHLGTDLLAAAGIRNIQGILNGTTNYILTRMEAGESYQTALADAQAQCYAEADPTGDVEGYDAAGKIVILSTLLFEASITMDQVDREGITGLSAEDIDRAQARGKRWKLIGSLEKSGDQINASVKPTLITLDHPLAAVSGATNALTYTTDLLGDVTIIGPGAGREETGFALLCDLFAIYRKSIKFL